MREAVQVICCGKATTTKYCPHCGKAVELSPLLSLLDHVDRYVKALEKKISKRSQLLASKPEGNEEWKARLTRYLENDRTSLSRWGAWSKALSELVQVNGHA